MKDEKFSVKLALGFVYFAMVIMVLITVFFPFLVQNFVEVLHKNPVLATTIMIVFYPCVPFIAIFLVTLRNILINVKRGDVFGDANLRNFKILSFCCLFSAIIMIIGGFKYMPFWLSGMAAAAGALLILVVESVFKAALYKQREKDYKSVVDKYEKDIKND